MLNIVDIQYCERLFFDIWQHTSSEFYWGIIIAYCETEELFIR